MKAQVLLILLVLLAACRDEKKEASSFPETSIDRLAQRDIVMSKPNTDDWLHEHKEAGQTFDQYTKSNPIVPSGRKNKIYLQPIGEFSEIENNLVIHTANYLKIFFSLETLILPVVKDTIVPKSARRVMESGEQLKRDLLWTFCNEIFRRMAL